MSSPTLRVHGDGREPKTTHTQESSNDASVPDTLNLDIPHSLAQETNKLVINFFSARSNKTKYDHSSATPLCANLRTPAMAQSLQDELLQPRNERSVILFPMSSMNLCMPRGVVQSDEVEVTTEETKMSI